MDFAVVRGKKLGVNRDIADAGIHTRIIGASGIKDAVIELNTYCKICEELPKGITRESFEKNEHAYWAKRLINDANLQLSSHGRIDVGTLADLKNIGINPIRDDKGQLAYEMPKELGLEFKKDEV